MVEKKFDYLRKIIEKYIYKYFQSDFFVWLKRHSITLFISGISFILVFWSVTKIVPIIPEDAGESISNGNINNLAGLLIFIAVIVTLMAFTFFTHEITLKLVSDNQIVSERFDIYNLSKYTVLFLFTQLIIAVIYSLLSKPLSYSDFIEMVLIFSVIYVFISVISLFISLISSLIDSNKLIGRQNQFKSERVNVIIEWLGKCSVNLIKKKYHKRIEYSLMIIIMLMFFVFTILESSNEKLLFFNYSKYIFHLYTLLIIIKTIQLFLTLLVGNRGNIEAIEINNINITSEELSGMPIIILKQSKKYNDHIMLRIKKSDLCKEIKYECNIQIVNPDCIVVKNTDNSSSVDYCFVVAGLNTRNYSNFVSLEIEVSYKTKSQYIKEYSEIVIKIEDIDGVIIPTEKYHTDYNIKTRKLRKSNAKIQKDNEGTEVSRLLDLDPINKGKLLSSLMNVYCIDSKDMKLEFNKAIYDSRKFLLHSDKLGEGKSTYDTLSIIQQNRIPIVISPWEANYDHDILYLIFDSVRNTTKYSIYPPFKGRFLFKFFIVGMILTIVNGAISIIELLKIDLLYTFDIKITIVIFSILLFWGFNIVLNRLMPEIIIFKKDHTKIYRKFYTSYIYNALKNNSNYMLLIEDVDRLELSSQLEVFRILSQINSSFPNVSKPVGILSLDKNNEMYSIQSPQLNFEEIENKLISSSMESNYNPNLFKKDYSELIIDTIEILFGQSNSMVLTKKSIEKILNNNFANFREINYLLSDITSTLDFNDLTDGNIKKMDSSISSKLEFYIESKSEVYHI